MKTTKKRDYDETMGRFLSLVLRHNPGAAGIRLDPHGWADVEALLSGVAHTGRRLSMEDLERIVRENKKQRYRFNEDHTKIRANQGHSLGVDLELSPLSPPDILYHGTAVRFLDRIREEGLTRQSRQQVHLSADRDTAEAVGSRHGAAAVLMVDAKSMAEEGYLFYQAENGVWLCDYVPWRFAELLE